MATPTSHPQAERLIVGKATHYGVAAIALGLGIYIWWATGDPATPPESPKPSMYVGAVLDVPITLVTADKSDLACAVDADFDGYRCQYQTKEKAWEGLDPKNPEHRKKMLVPYMTVDDVMFLIPGMFEDPAVDERYRDELPKARSRERLERFTAQCKLKLIREVENVVVRWKPEGEWQGPHKVWIGEASSCQVSEP